MAHEFVPGTILDAGAFGGDTQLATDWYTKLATLTWDGNQDVNDGAGIYLLASQNNGNQPRSGAAVRQRVPGDDRRLRPARRQPGRASRATSASYRRSADRACRPTSSTQGGAIFANSYVRNLRITNNVVQSNGGAYGTIRIGTPDLPGQPARPEQRERP